MFLSQLDLMNNYCVPYDLITQQAFYTSVVSWCLAFNIDKLGSSKWMVSHKFDNS